MLVLLPLLAIKKAGASAELDVYAKTGHGFNLRPNSRGAVAKWLERFEEWQATLW